MLLTHASLRARTKALAYAATSKRDLRIDLLRGWAVLTMLIDHVAGPSFLNRLTAGGNFFTSAAEGFVFIAGFITVVVYGRLADGHGSRTAAGKLLRRAVRLYVLCVLLTLLVVPISEHFGAGPCGGCTVRGIPLTDPLAFVAGVASMHQTYYLVDILLLYTRLFLLAPLALIALRTGRTWLLLAASVCVWAANLIAPEAVVPGWKVADNATFHLAGWQLPFVLGMVLAQHRARLARVIHPRAYGVWLAVMLGLCAGLILLYKAGAGTVFGQQFFAKPDLGPGRILASVVVFTAAFLVVHLAWRPLRLVLGWLLLPLGQHALHAYTVHVLVGVALVAVQASTQRSVTGASLPDALLQAGTIGVTWLSIRTGVFRTGVFGLHAWRASIAGVQLAPARVSQLGARRRTALPRPEPAPLDQAAA